MSNSKADIAITIIANSSPFKQGLSQASTGVRKFASGVKGEFNRIRQHLSGIKGQLAALGLGIGTAKIITDSARLDKKLIQIGQTAGATKDQIKALRSELFVMGSRTGKGVDDLAEGFNSLIQSGLSFSESVATIKAINDAMAVTGSNADTLAKGLTTAATAFQFDLSNVKTAQDILDKMVVAGRLGNAELENLSDIFARVAVNAKTAGMSFNQTLSFIETLSMIEKSPERLATLADSTLRLFTNLKYSQQVQKSTNIKFFDAAGARREAFAVLDDIRNKYAKLGTEREKALFVSKVLKGADLDTIRGMRMLLEGDMLQKGRTFAEEIGNAGGVLQKDLKGAVDNAVSQAGRLKNILRSAADAFAQPIDRAFTSAVKKLTGSRAEGGFGLSGKQLIGLGIAGVGTSYAAARLLKGPLGRLLGGGASTATSLAQAAAIERTTGINVVPVTVVNWPAGLTTGVGGGALPGGRMGLGALGRLSPALGTAGGAAAILGAGWFLIDKLNKAGEEYVRSHYTPTPGSIEDALSPKFQGLGGDRLKNDININISIPDRGAVVTKTEGKNVSSNVKVNRGNLDPWYFLEKAR